MKKDKQRYLELETTHLSDRWVKFKIKTQTHRNDNFSVRMLKRRNETDEFYDDETGIRLCSCGMPDVSGTTLFLRGHSRNEDKRELMCSLDDYEKFQIAVRNYNIFFTKGHELDGIRLQDNLFVIR